MARVAVLACVWMRTHTENEKGKESFRSISQLNILGHKSSANIFGLLSQWIPELLGRPAFYWPSCERLVGKEWAHVGPWFLPTALQWWSNICCSFFWPCITRDQVVLLWRIQGKMCTLSQGCRLRRDMVRADGLQLAWHTWALASCMAFRNFSVTQTPVSFFAK